MPRCDPPRSLLKDNLNFRCNKSNQITGLEKIQSKFTEFQFYLSLNKKLRTITEIQRIIGLIFFFGSVMD